MYTKFEWIMYSSSKFEFHKDSHIARVKDANGDTLLFYIFSKVSVDSKMDNWIKF